MLVHVVMWKFKKGEEEKTDVFLAGLKSLKGIIPQIVDMEVGKNVNPKNEFGAVLVSKFNSAADLEIYKNHPEHIKVSALCKEIRTDRQAVDFEI
ncbi:MAG: Dabb family protein [Candidatus Borkfalkiaceae bacterium]|nr:Dabb family protein [Christensenellaceae bacterium]